MANLNNLGVALFNALGRGYLDNRERQREEESYNQGLRRKEQQLRMASDMRVREETERIGAEQKRKQDFINQRIEEVKTMFPDRWEKEPGFQQKVVSSLRGIVIPAEPANKEIGRLFSDGKYEDALKLASQSANPADLQFFNDTVAARKSFQAFRNLMDPKQTISSGGYLHTFNPNDPLNTLQSKALPSRIPVNGSRGAGNSSSGFKQSLWLKEKQIQNAQEVIKQMQENAWDLPSDEREALKVVIGEEQAKLNNLRREYDQMLSTGEARGGLVRELTQPLPGKRSFAYDLLTKKIGDTFGNAVQLLQQKQGNGSAAKNSPSLPPAATPASMQAPLSDSEDEFVSTIYSDAYQGASDLANSAYDGTGRVVSGIAKIPGITFDAGAQLVEDATAPVTKKQYEKLSAIGRFLAKLGINMIPARQRK